MAYVNTLYQASSSYRDDLPSASYQELLRLQVQLQQEEKKKKYALQHEKGSRIARE